MYNNVPIQTSEPKSVLNLKNINSNINSNIDKIINEFIIKNDSFEAFYIVNLYEIEKAYNNWVKFLPNIKLFYAIKCNTNPLILELLSQLNINFDCASQNEIQTILSITNDPLRIIYANPIKSIKELKYAKEQNVNLLTFDNKEELLKIKLYHPKANMLLRLAVDDRFSRCKFSKKFGCKMENVKELLELSIKEKINIVGFSFHVGSSCESTDSFYDAICNCRKATDIANQLNIQISIIDIGGGFTSIHPNISFEDVAKKINMAMIDFFDDEIKNKQISFISEVGRYFVEKSHTLVVNVIGKNIIREEDSDEYIYSYYLNESTYGSFNCINNDHYLPTIKLPIIDKTNDNDKNDNDNDNDNDNNNKNNFKKSRLWGNTCDGVDLICNEVMLPELNISDYLYFENMGAYTVCASSHFNGFSPVNNYKYIYYES